MNITNLKNLKNEGSVARKVGIWLDSIQEYDPAQREEVQAQCRDVKESREYFLMRYEQDCTGANTGKAVELMDTSRGL